MKTFKVGLAMIVAATALHLHAAQADQPRMKEALHHLRDAREALVRAEHNKHGHRDKALQFVDQAIAEVEAGIASAR